MRIKYISDQTNSTIVDLINSIRQDDLERAIACIAKQTKSHLSTQDMNFARALAQVDHIQQLVNSPNMLLGRMNTKHGELAEQVEVAIQNSKTLLRGMGYCATADPKIVGRTVNAPVDYIIKGAQVQSKFINSETNTLSHVIEHLGKYEKIGFGRDSGSYYHIPKDQYEVIVKALRTGKIEGRRLSSVESIVSKANEIERLTGRNFTDVVRPAHVKYGEVQWGKIDGTIEKIRFDINEENNEIVKKIKDESKRKKDGAIQSHNPSFGEAAKTAGVAAAVSGGITLIANIYNKTKNGKKIEDFSENDWKDVGLNTADASLRGGVSGLAIYELTNCVGMTAPIAAGTVSAVLGIGELVIRYNKKEITSDELIEQGKLLCLNSVAATIGSVVGQQLIPIPVLGAVIGSMAGTYCVDIVTSLLDGEESKEIIDQYSPKKKSDFQGELFCQLTGKYGKMLELTNVAFDINANYSLRLLASQELARKSGVSESDILHSIKEVDAYFLA